MLNQPRIAAIVLISLSSLSAAQTPTSAPAATNSLAAGRSSASTGHMSYFEGLKNAVELDVAQQRRVQALLKTADTDFRAARLEMNPSPEVSRRMAETVREIQAAKAAGDSAKQKELVDERARITRGYIEKRDKMVASMNAIDEVLKRNIAETLRPDQLEKFETFWTARHGAAKDSNKRPYDGLIRSAVALKAATDRLGDLTPDQQTQIDAAFKTHQETMRTAPKPAVEEQALRTLYMRVFEVFTDGQRERVEQELTPKDAPKSAQPASAPAAEPARSTPAPKAP